MLSIFDIAVKKLADALADRATAIANTDKTRAAAYEAFFALRRIEEVLGKMEQKLDRVDGIIRYSRGRKINVASDDEQVLRTMHNTVPELRELQDRLLELTKAFERMKPKLEIYQSIVDSDFVKTYICDDLFIVFTIYESKRNPYKSTKNLEKSEKELTMRQMHATMQSSTIEAREIVRKFIKDNYGVEKRADGR